MSRVPDLKVGSGDGALPHQSQGPRSPPRKKLPYPSRRRSTKCRAHASAHTCQFKYRCANQNRERPPISLRARIPWYWRTWTLGQRGRNGSRQFWGFQGDLAKPPRQQLRRLAKSTVEGYKTVRLSRVLKQIGMCTNRRCCVVIEAAVGQDRPAFGGTSTTRAVPPPIRPDQVQR